jgi:hypothetical protein
MPAMPEVVPAMSKALVAMAATRVSWHRTRHKEHHQHPAQDQPLQPYGGCLVPVAHRIPLAHAKT